MKTLTMLLSAALITASSPAIADVKPPDEVSEGLMKLAEPRYRAMEEVVRRDAKLAAELAAYRVAVKSILQNTRLGEAERKKQLGDLSRRIEPSAKFLLQKARIDERLYKEEGERHIKRMAARQNKQYQAQYLGYLGWFWRLYPLPKKTVKPADKEITLSAPFPLTQKEEGGGGNIEVNKNAGEYSVTSLIVMAGGHENVAGLAHFFAVDNNYDKIQTFAALPETGWNVFAFADFFGVFGASAKSRIEVFSNNQVICREEVEHGNVLAPVIFFADQSGTDNIVTNCEIESPDQGDEIVIRATSVAGAWGGVVGVARGSVSATPRDLRLLLKF